MTDTVNRVLRHEAPAAFDGIPYDGGSANMGVKKENGRADGYSGGQSHSNRVG